MLGFPGLLLLFAGGENVKGKRKMGSHEKKKYLKLFHKDLQCALSAIYANISSFLMVKWSVIKLLYLKLQGFY